MKKEVVYRITRTQYKKLEVETKEQEELVKELNRDFEREVKREKTARARNVSLEYLMESEGFEPVADIQTGEDAYIQKTESETLKKRVHSAIAVLTPRQKEIVIPIKEIAIQLNVSETSLKNYFRGVYGKNISDYLRDLRMEYAKKLLTETKLPISEIAYMTGYTKQGKFAEVFREKFQLKPLEFRRTYNLNKPITKE